MQSLKNKLLLLSLAFFISLLASCSTEVYNKKYYITTSPSFFALPPLEPNFIVCSSIFTSKRSVDYRADMTCSTQRKKAQFVHKRYFQTCYFTQPIAYTYECV